MDIYTLSSTDSAFAALMNRGFMAELDGEVKEEDKIKQLDSIVLTPSKTADSLVFSSKL